MDGVNAVVWAPGNQGILYSGGSDGNLRIWSLRNGGQDPLRTLSTEDGGGLMSICLMEQVMDDRGYEIRLDDTMLCCGTETGKTCIFSKDLSDVGPLQSRPLRRI